MLATTTTRGFPVYVCVACGYKYRSDKRAFACSNRPPCPECGGVLAVGRYLDKERRRRRKEERDALQAPPKDDPRVGRCPTCRCRVIMPCRACAVREFMATQEASRCQI